MGQVAILSHVVRDRIYRGGAPMIEEVGGAGAYAAVGAALAAADPSERPLLVAGTGLTDLGLLKSWAVRRGIDASGLFVVGQRGPVTEVRYANDAERVETPVFGLDHFVAHTPLPSHIGVPLDELAGLYLFHNAEPEYWHHIADLRPTYSGVIMWEVAADCCAPEFWTQVSAAASQVDILVINLAEARELTGLIDQPDVFRRMAELAPMALVHDGTRGTNIITDGHVAWVGIREVTAVDVTGGGNSFSGAWLQAVVDGANPVEASRLAASAAAEVVAVQGSPLIDAALRQRVRSAASGVPARS